MDDQALTRLPIWIIAFIISLTFHEFAHAWMAHKRGDDTALYAGRLTLNPIVHIDPVGLIVLIVIFMSHGYGFGWAKPVPFNPNRLRNPKMDIGLVAAAGPISNIIQAIFFCTLFKLFETQIIASPGAMRFFGIFIWLNIILAGFNLIPIPPLDGSKILFSFLPANMLGFYNKLERYGMLILIVLFFTPLGRYVIPVFIFPLLRGLFSIFNLPYDLLNYT